MSRWKVNIRLLPVKAHYFFFNAGSAALYPFIPVLGKQLGISSAEVGAIYGAAPFLSFIAKPTFGFIADHFKKRKSIFLFCIVLSLMASICIGFLNQVPTKRPVVFECGLGVSFIKQCNQSPQSCSASESDDENSGVVAYFKKYPPSYPLPEEENEEIEDGESINSKNSTNDFDENDFTNKTLETGRLVSYVDEKCTIHCQIHSVYQFLDFCNSLDEAYMPSDCFRRVQECESRPRKRSVLSSMSSTPDSIETVELDEQEDVESNHKSRSGYKEIEPYLLEFDVNLQLSKSFVGDCLFLRVHAISFKPGVDEMQPFTCLSNQNILDTCFADCPNNIELNTKLERIMSDSESEESFLNTKFWLYGVLVIIVFLSMATINSISDALCFQLLGERSDLFGSQRLWGAVGWGLFTLLSGFLIDSNSEGKLLKDYTPCFYLMAALLILDLIVAYKWEWIQDEFSSLDQSDIKEMPKAKTLAKDVWSLLTEIRIIVFIFACLIVGMCTGLHWHFLLWYVEDVAAANCDDTAHLKTLQGLMVAIQCLSEMPFFYYARSFIKRLGYVNCITMVLFIFGIRFLLYSTIPHIWLFIPVELFHGITFSIFYSVMATYASTISPPGTSATVQGIFGASFEGIGVAIGSLVGGALYQLWGGKTAFRVFGIGAIVFCVIHHILMLVFRQKRAFGVPISATDSIEPEGREMCDLNGVSHEDIDSE